MAQTAFFTAILKFCIIFLCFFDTSSLFTTIPRKEIIQIEADTLYNIEFISPTISKALFTEILSPAITSVQFSFNNTMHNID